MIPNLCYVYYGIRQKKSALVLQGIKFFTAAEKKCKYKILKVRKTQYQILIGNNDTNYVDIISWKVVEKQETHWSENITSQMSQ